MSVNDHDLAEAFQPQPKAVGSLRLILQQSTATYVKLSGPKLFLDLWDLLCPPTSVRVEGDGVVSPPTVFLLGDLNCVGFDGPQLV